LILLSLGAWTPIDPRTNLFSGSWDSAGEFLHLEMHLSGLAHPPGPVEPWNFDPFRYGEHPVYAFVEIDMDGDPDTGGELAAPQYRYLGNAVRFGGKVLRPEYAGRVAQSGAAFDGDFTSPPFVERHGEEFHAALLGNEFDPSDITVTAGDDDFVFEPGETWTIVGNFFHRAHGYEPFSFVKGGRVAGEYAPPCHLQFRHDPAAGKTLLSLVFPLTNVGAGLMRGEAPQPTNHDPTDHASVLEGLEDLQLSAFFLPIFSSGLPEEAIIANWADRNPSDYLDPAQWELTAILGSSYLQPAPDALLIVWADIFPNVIVGDVNGSGMFDGRDRQAIAQYIAQRDASDGVIDGAVRIVNFAEDFSLFDVNHDGFINGFDLTPVDPSADGDGDGDVDLFDFALLQRCYAEGAGVTGTCHSLDLNSDLAVDLQDLGLFYIVFAGPDQ
jgi:hypothetical protein